jgi:hypothetical protein
MILDNIKYDPTVNGKRRNATTQKIILKAFFIVFILNVCMVITNS